MSGQFRDQVQKFLRDATLSKAEVDRFVDPNAPRWARFDAELGYVPNDSRVPDGIDGSISTYSYGPLGERQTMNYAARPCRISTYGNSFTQCHQVSDGETWQEVLAAHIGEPIRNFGVGGYGVYQAYRRLTRVELGPQGTTEYIILNIFDDDHYRNLDAYRLLRVGKWWRDYDRSLSTSMFHANPWCHVRLDPSTGGLVHRPNLCDTSESLYMLCDEDFLVSNYQDDLVVKLIVGGNVGEFGFLEEYEELAGVLGISLRTGNALEGSQAAQQLYRAMAFRSSALIVESLGRELEERGAKLMVLLSYSDKAVRQVLRHGPRADEWFLRALEGLNVVFVDSLGIHVSDYQEFSVEPEVYVGRLYNGHYTPAGNHFFASSVRRDIVGWLSPPPPAYRDREMSFAAQAARLA